MINRVKSLLLMIMVFLCSQASAAILSNIQVFNKNSQARIICNFIGNPEYTFSQLDNRSIVLDIKQIGIIHGLPLQFSGNNLVKSIYPGTPKNAHLLRLVVFLTKKSKTKVIKHQNGAKYTVVFTISSNIPASSMSVKHMKKPAYTQKLSETVHNSFETQNNLITNTTNSNTIIHPTTSTRYLPVNDDKIIVAIDAGHGGQDPGAIGHGGTREKNVTIAIARKLRALLNEDPMFKGVMTREGDYFISVVGRSEVARKQNANFLVSIHADAAPNRSAKGASAWVLSNRRANSEMANWLEEHEKQSELLGGAGNMLVNSQSDPYLSQVVLDLQFGHSQRVGYSVAVNVLNQLKSVGSLHKHRPEHASLGVLRSPDIPSILVETGFISNNDEERLLASNIHQKEIAGAIYQGMRNYFNAHPLHSVS